MSESFVTTQELLELAQAMNSKYQHFLEGRIFSINATTDNSGVYVTVTLAEADKGFSYPVEARLDHTKEELTQRRAAFFLIDYADLYFHEYLMEEEEDVFLPIDWADFEWDTVKFQMKGQILKPRIEAAADDLLIGAGYDVLGNVPGSAETEAH